MPDQLRADCGGKAFGNEVIHTPHLDALAARGTAFTSAFSQHSVCGPSRASIFTGWYPHVAGHRTLDNLLKPWEPNLLRGLRDAGYHVAWLGERGDTFAPGVADASCDVHGFLVEPDFWFERSPFGRDDKWFTRMYYGLRDGGDDGGPALDFDEATIRSFEQWIAAEPPEPWVCLVALFFPHPPFVVEEPWYSRHDRAAMPPPAPVPERGPRYLDVLRREWQTGALTPDDWAELAATYYGMVSRVDSQLGRVIDAVDRAGAGDRTLTCFFTDHGEYLGDYDLVEKWPAGQHDVLLRNPFVVAGPGVREGLVTDTLVEMVDLLPTLFEAAGTEARHTHFGRSLWPVLSGTADAHRDAAFAEGGFTRAEEPLLERSGPASAYFGKGQVQHDDPDAVGKVVSVRTADWTYVYRLYEDPELYDRRHDGQELSNLAGTPGVADVERALRDRVLEWMVGTADQIPWVADPRLGRSRPTVRGRRDPIPSPGQDGRAVQA